jgi:hypothetical protein
MVTMTLQQPIYDANPIYFQQFAAFVEIGTFIIFKEDGDQAMMPEVVGQILREDLASTVVVSLFKPFENLLKKETPITDGPGRCLQEIIHTCSQKCIKRSQISNLAFVFSPQKLEDLGAILQGISYAFVCRFSSDGACFKPITFPCESKECPMPCSLTRKLFKDNERVRDVIVGVLNRVSELQGDHARVLKHSYCSPEFWSYLKYLTRGSDIKVHCVSGKRIRCRLLH